MRSPIKAALLLAIFALSSVGTPTLAVAAPPTSAATDNGAYVILGKPPTPGAVSFSFGWNSSSQFAAPAVGCWVGIYDVTNSTYVWASDNVLPQLSYPNPGEFNWQSVALKYTDDTTLPPGDYSINFFVRSSYDYPVTNVAVIELKFTVR